MGSSRIQGAVSVNFGGCSDINLCMQDGGQTISLGCRLVFQILRIGSVSHELIVIIL